MHFWRYSLKLQYPRRRIAFSRHLHPKNRLRYRDFRHLTKSHPRQQLLFCWTCYNRFSIKNIAFCRTKRPKNRKNTQTLPGSQFLSTVLSGRVILHFWTKNATCPGVYIAYCPKRFQLSPKVWGFWGTGGTEIDPIPALPRFPTYCGQIHKMPRKG